MLPFEKARTFFVLQIGFGQFSHPIGQSDPQGHSEDILFCTVGDLEHFLIREDRMDAYV